MRSFAVVLSALAAFAVAQDSSSVPVPSNPATQYTTQTNSMGVITGMPAVVTSQPIQPGVVTSQPLPASLPALGDGLQTVTQGNNTYTVVVSGSSTSFVIKTSTTSSASGTGAAGSSGNGTSTSSKGAAATGKAAAGALIGAAGLFAALL